MQSQMDRMGAEEEDEMEKRGSMVKKSTSERMDRKDPPKKEI